MKIFDELKLVVGDLVLVLQLVILVLQTTHSDFEQLVLSFAFHCAVLVELVLRVLVIVLFLPRLDLFTQLLFCLLLLLGLTSKLSHSLFEPLDLFILKVCVLLRCEVFHGTQQLLLLALDLDVVRRHVLILVLLQHF